MSNKNLVVRTITVTWPEETLQPIQYTAMKIGGLSMVVQVGLDDDPMDVYKRAQSMLNDMAREQYEKKLADFLKRVKHCALKARS